MKNIFEKAVTDELVNRIDQLSATIQPKWGEMNVGQMLAHCSVAYEMIDEPDRFPRPNGFARLMLRLFVKPIVVGDKPYKKNSRTAPAFLITDEREFQLEKEKLVDFMYKTQGLGVTYFDNKASHSFGNLSVKEWNNTFYNHLDHHLNQFGV